MQIKIYVAGPHLQDGKRKLGRSTAGIRDPFEHIRDIPVVLDAKEIGRSYRMEKISISQIPYLSFEAELNIGGIDPYLCGISDGLLADAKGTGWANIGIIPLELHLKTCKTNP